MATLLQDLGNLKPEEIEVRSLESLEWFRANLRRVKTRPERLYKEGEFVSKVMIGKMYMFFYNAKMQDTLPYWDRFPVVIPLEYYQDGFLGLNLHYIAPRYRVALLGALYEHFNNDEYDDTTRLRVSYDLLRSLQKFRWAKPCFKRYLKTNIDSLVSEVPIEHWDVVAMLPTQRFNVNANYVYRESRKRF